MVVRTKIRARLNHPRHGAVELLSLLLSRVHCRDWPDCAYSVYRR